MSHISSVLQRIVAQASVRPGGIALRRADGTSALGYGQLISEVARLAKCLSEQSVGAGARVIVLSDNGPETYLAVLACARLNAIAVMVDGGLPSATITRFCEVTEPSAILITPTSRAGSPLPLGHDGTPTILVSVSKVEVEETSAPEDIDDCPSDTPLAMIFTSGTTGEPKAVLLSNRTFFAIPDILQANDLDWIDWVPGETTYSPLPATHIGGLWWILNGLMHGAVCVTGGEVGPSLTATLNTNAVATTSLVPTLLSRLIAELKTGDASVPTLRLIGYGGSRAITSDVQFVEAEGIRTAQVYGLSETGCTALCLPTGRGSLAKIEEGAVGRPYPGVQVCLAEGTTAIPDFAADDSSVTYGTLWVKSPANMLGYWNNPRRTAETLVDGWVNTGDLFERREDGFFYIRGRSSEMIISGGVNVVPDEVDRIADGVSGVLDAACYEISDPDFGALVGLAVVPATELSDEGQTELKRHIAATYRRESESIARPSVIVIVGEIPRTKSGKVMRTSLASAMTVNLVSGAGT
ncbi:fatty acid--CoA ligase FadD10 [Mycobacteroides salmoniphilum]|uniref:fatty acid--CoA ligase FadD10 n=1 Tax=Mycobacteroides salmoniphilum TaxID=404941 RepID=UPI0009947DBC|nr:fatty acid--CoA ligase FadD10 [Mycobacteroides salmoniphilum]